MNLETLHSKLSPAEKDALAAHCGVSAAYIRQLAQKFRTNPSIRLLWLLSTGDRRLKVAHVAEEFAAAQAPGATVAETQMPA